MPHTHPGNRSRNRPSNGKKDELARHDRRHRHGQRNVVAERILETACSTSDLKNPGTVGLPSRKIYAIASPRENDLQQTSVLEAKHGLAGQNRNIKTRASAGLLRRSCASTYRTQGE